MNRLLVITLTSLLLSGTAQAHHGEGGKHGGKHQRILLSKLDLAEDQKQPVAEILKEQRQKRKEIMKPEFEQIKPQMEALHKETRQRLAAVLTEEQLQKYDALSGKRHQRMQRRFERRYQSRSDGS